MLRMSNLGKWLRASVVFTIGSFILLSYPVVSTAAQPGTDLRNELAAARDYRAFALNALQRPAEGGYFYARFVADQCGYDFAAIQKLSDKFVRAEIAKNRTIQQFQLTLMQDLPRKCSAFAAGEPTQINKRVREATESSDIDPLIAAHRKALAALRSQDANAIRAAFGTLLRINDPLLWTEHGLNQLFAAADPEAKKQGGIFMGGVVYGPDDRLKLIEAKLSLDLGYCRPELPCFSDFLLRLNCAVGGSCTPDRIALAKEVYFSEGGDETGWGRIMALQSQIRAALAAGDARMFVR